MPHIPFHHLPHTETASEREVWFTTERGRWWKINVAQHAIVKETCERDDAYGCVIVDAGKKIGEMWMVDSFAVALHECAHIFALDAGWTRELIERELSHTGLPRELTLQGLWETYGDKPANREPCGPSPYYTGMGWSDWTQAVRYGEHAGGRLLTLEEWTWLMEEQDVDGSAWR